MKKLISFLTVLSFIFLMLSCEKANSPPTIINLIASQTNVDSEGTVMFSCEAQDPDGDPIMYRWSCLSGNFISETSSSTTMWQAPLTNSETISRVIVQIADSNHSFDGPFSESRAIIIFVNPVARCTVENFGTIIVKNDASFPIRVNCSREDPTCPSCVYIDPTPIVYLSVGQSTTFEIKPGNIVCSAIAESDWQLGLGGPWTQTVPFPLSQCETKTVPWTD